MYQFPTTLTQAHITGIRAAMIDDGDEPSQPELTDDEIRVAYATMHEVMHDLAEPKAILRLLMAKCRIVFYFAEQMSESEANHG